MLDLVRTTFAEAREHLDAVLSNEALMQSVATAAVDLGNALKSGSRVYSCGNGGSMCDAMHFAEELSGRYRENRPALAAQAISDVGHMTCVANDFGYDRVFSRYVEAHGRSGDFLLAISTSGKSPSILNAVEVAHQRGMKVIGLHGKPGSELDRIADYSIGTACGQYADRVQELHIKVIHIVIDIVERVNFG